MKRIALILTALFLFSGCGWFGRKNRVIQPSEETPATAPVSGPVEAGGTGFQPVLKTEKRTDSKPAPTERTTRPSADYRVVGKPEVVAAASLQVNNKFITLRKLLDPIRPKLTAAAAGAGEEAFRIKALGLIREEIRRQVEHVLLLSEAENYLTDAEKKQVDEWVVGRLRQAVAESGGSRALFDQRLRNEGTDLETWKKDLTETMLIRSYMQSRLGKRIVVDRRIMWDYYVAHPREFSRPDRVQMQIISVPRGEFLPTDRKPDEEDRAESHRKAKDLINKAHAALVSGEKFAKVARTFSTGPMSASGGVWPLMERGSFRAEAVEESAFAQGKGRTSGVIETPGGFYIVRTLDIRGGEKLPFEKVQDTIADKLRRRQFAKLADEYRAKLYAKAVIIATDRFERLAVDEAVRKYYKR
ncbi:MAG: peptidyl-prolyl cis-trans isomerase [Planctomycetota bacterium]|nr:peptidyl-prolyl cis-trans isomerase [Planctomycetota bacterium]